MKHDKFCPRGGCICVELEKARTDELSRMEAMITAQTQEEVERQAGKIATIAANEERDRVRNLLSSDGAVGVFGGGWRSVDSEAAEYRDGDRRRAGLRAVADWMFGGLA